MTHKDLHSKFDVPLLQVAAMCVRWKKNGKPRILMITSRETKRWIIPKGWPMTGKTHAAAATIEAWEEAGVIAKRNTPTPHVGTFYYKKRTKKKRFKNTQTVVFLLETHKLAKRFPEKGQRKVRWVSQRKAEKYLSDEGLAKIIRGMRKSKFLIDYHDAKGSEG